jgi:AraC family transcriptional regulator
MSYPPPSDLVLHQDQLGGSRVSGTSGGWYFNMKREKVAFFLAGPNFADAIMVDTS